MRGWSSFRRRLSSKLFRRPAGRHACPMSVDLPQARDLAELIVRSVHELGGKAHRADITAKALEIGRFSQTQRDEPTHAVSKRGTYPTELHYRLSWAITHAHNNGDIERVERSIWQLTRR